METEPGKVSGVLSIIACALVVVHIVLALVIVVYPDASQGSRVLTFYRRLFVLGPFFQEPRIVKSPHLWVSLYKDSAWSPPHDNGCSDVNISGASYHAIKVRAFEEFLGGQAAERIPLNGRSRAERELEDYVRSRVQDSGADSVGVAYVFRRAAPRENEVAADTVFYLKFKL